jgi:hypothetical protein
LPTSVDRRQTWASLLMPAVLLVVLTALQVARPATAPASASGVAHYLQAESLLQDQNSSFEEEDLDRLRQLPQTESLSVLLARHRDGRAVYPGPGLTALWLVPFVAFGGLNGAVFGTALAVVWAMGLAAVTMKQQLHTPWGLLLLALFGSAAIRCVTEPRPEALVLAAVLAALAIAYRGETPQFVEMPEIYDDSVGPGGWRFALRWVVVGVLLAVATLYHPLYALLFVPAGLAVPNAARRGGLAWTIGGAAVILLPTLGISGVTSGLPWLRDAEVFTTVTGFPDLGADWGDGSGMPSLVAAAQPRLDAGLIGWNAFFLVGGQTVGALPYFLPLLLLLAPWEPRKGRSPLVASVAAMAVLAILIWPFDWAGGPGMLGNALLLPAFGALWLLPTRPVRGAWILVMAIAAGVFLWPTWLETVGLRPAPATPSRSVSPVAGRWLPLESTLRAGESDLIREGSLAVRVVGGAAASRGGRIVIQGGAWGEVLLIAPQDVESVLLEFDGQAGTELDLTGGTLGNTVFRGDGRVAFEVLLGERGRRHPMWWSPLEQSLYDLRLRLPDAPPYPVAFRVRPLDGSSL